MNQIPTALRAARTRKGLTVREVAPMVQAGESQISTWENGHVEPRADVLRRYVKAELLTRAEAADLLLGDPEAA